MGYSRGTCEIVEAKNELSSSQTPQQERGQRPHVRRCLEDDINKLFEAVNVRTSKSLDLSKRPIRSPGSHSPGIGLSEPVSLKQALRGLCISQAAEMAATKRLSMQSASPSPRISETRRNSNLYRSLGIEARVSGCYQALIGENGTEIRPVAEESTSYSSGSLKSAAQSSCSSPGYNIKPDMKCMVSIPSEPGQEVVECNGYGVEKSLTEESTTGANSSSQVPSSSEVKVLASSSVCDNTVKVSEADKQEMEAVNLLEGKQNSLSDSNDNVSKPDNNLSGQRKVVKRPGPKPRHKPRTVKPVIRNKNLIIKKSKKAVGSNEGNSKSSHEVSSGLDHGSAQLFCQRCQCALRDTNTNSIVNHPGGDKCEASKPNPVPPGSDNKITHVNKTNMNVKLIEKVEISQSSSSICDFSSSTTSLSEESSLGGSARGNRPHMSKDMRWEAIISASKQYGFLELSHFNLLKKLGSGDIGTVYLAELIGTNCPFAIKIMDNEFLARRKKMARAQTEREILRMLDHPFLPTLYAQFTSDNLSCLVMEFCPGGDLHVLRQKQPGRYFPEQEARFYVAEVLLALEYLHMLGIVYRDLKPENILVREDGHIMLTDFDLSLRCSVNPTLIKSSSMGMDPPRVSGPCAGSNCIDPFCSGPSCKVSCFRPRLFPDTARTRRLKAGGAANVHARSLPELVVEPTEARSNSFVGTHEYLAPEIINGESHGSAVDWWTFGVLLYELLYGKTPFKGAGNGETLSNVVVQPLRFPDNPVISFQARDLIRGLLVKDPEKRLGTETGAAEIKRQPFFEGLNWALIRCAVPPQIPEFYDVVNASSNEKGTQFMKYNAKGEHLEFELF